MFYIKLKNRALEQSNIDNPILQIPIGAGEGISGVLRDLFNDQNEEAKLLAHQLELLKELTLYID